MPVHPPAIQLFPARYRTPILLSPRPPSTSAPPSPPYAGTPRHHLLLLLLLLPFSSLLLLFPFPLPPILIPTPRPHPDLHQPSAALFPSFPFLLFFSSSPSPTPSPTLSVLCEEVECRNISFCGKSLPEKQFRWANSIFQGANFPLPVLLNSEVVDY